MESREGDYLTMMEFNETMMELEDDDGISSFFCVFYIVKLPLKTKLKFTMLNFLPNNRFNYFIWRFEASFDH